MNNEEPIRAVDENQQFSTHNAPIPEQSGLPMTTMPRQISILNWINQWQPMGYRVILSLPFIGDDQNFLFAIRNGPFIPMRSDQGWLDMGPGGTQGGYTVSGVLSYGLNNMSPIILPSNTGNAYPDPSKPVISITNYDMPPIISTMAHSFRRWRGDMQYRLRMVAGFATQGYIIASTLRNVISPIGIYNQFKFPPFLEREDISYKAAMINSYALSDTSMFRHMELTVPYDYPMPYYDQYNWISQRVTPSMYYDITTSAGKATVKEKKKILQTEPSGDNWIVIGLRGNLEAGSAGSQVIFELEYRCAEGFQFADPFFPPTMTPFAFKNIPASSRVYTLPSSHFLTDGIGIIHPNNKQRRDLLHLNFLSPEGHQRTSMNRSRSPSPRRSTGYNQSDLAGLSALERLQLASSRVMGHSSRNE